MSHYLGYPLIQTVGLLKRDVRQSACGHPPSAVHEANRSVPRTCRCLPRVSVAAFLLRVRGDRSYNYPSWYVSGFVVSAEGAKINFTRDA